MEPTPGRLRAQLRDRIFELRHAEEEHLSAVRRLRYRCARSIALLLYAVVDHPMKPHAAGR